MKRSNNPEGRPVGRSLDRKTLPCTKCGKTKKAEQFPILGGTRRGSWCKSCTSEHQHEMYLKRTQKAKKPKTKKKKVKK